MTLVHYVLSVVFTISVMAGIAVASDDRNKQPNPATGLRLSVTG